MITIGYFKNINDKLPTETKTYPNVPLAIYNQKILNAYIKYGKWKMIN